MNNTPTLALIAYPVALAAGVALYFSIRRTPTRPDWITQDTKPLTEGQRLAAYHLRRDTTRHNAHRYTPQPGAAPMKAKTKKKQPTTQAQQSPNLWPLGPR